MNSRHTPDHDGTTGRCTAVSGAGKALFLPTLGRPPLFLFAIAFFALSVCATAQGLPSWVGAGGEYSGSSSPHYSGWVAYATPVNTALQAYSFTLGQVLVVNGKLVKSVTTGVDDLLKTVPTKHGDFTVHGIGTIGGSTASSQQPTASGQQPTANQASPNALATAVGGGLMFRFRKQVWIFPPGFTVEVFALNNNIGSASKPSVLIGGGWTW